MIKRISFIVAMTVIALLGFTYLSQSKADTHESEEEHEEEVNTIPQKTGRVESPEQNGMIKANGTLVLRAQNMGEVASLMGGIVKNIYVKDGQQVGKGQVVATVENTEVVSLQREYFSASKESQMAKLELDRQNTLALNGGGVKKILQQAEKQYQVAQANLVGIARQLAQMGISPAAVAKGKFTTVFPLRAPIGGTISQITASVGSYADMQTPLMKIRNNGAVECDLNVFEKDINKIKVGNRVLLSLTNQPGVNVSGHVYGMNQYFNEGTKSVAVHVKLDVTHGAKLFDGMYVSGQIQIGNTK